MDHIVYDIARLELRLKGIALLLRLLPEEVNALLLLLPRCALLLLQALLRFLLLLR